MRATAKLVSWEDSTKGKRLLSLCEHYKIGDLAPGLNHLFLRAEGAMSSQVEHFTEVISMCDALLALRKKKLSSIIVGSIIEIKFSTSKIASEVIEKSLNEALLNECTELYDDSSPHNVGYVERFSVDTGNELYLIWKEHQGEIEAELERRSSLTELERFEEEFLLDYDSSVFSRLTDTEVRLIKSTYERFLDIETKAEGRYRKAEGSRTKNAKLGRLARQIMEKLPEDMEHKHLFVAEFLMASGALAYKGESWMDSFQVKPDNEKERFVRIWIDSSL